MKAGEAVWRTLQGKAVIINSPIWTIPLVDHHLQMIKAPLPFLEVPETKAVSVFVKAQELKNTLELFETEEIASMGNLFSGRTSVPRLCQRAFKGDTALWNPTGTGSNRSGKAFIEGQTPWNSCAVSCLQNSRPVLKHFK